MIISKEKQSVKYLICTIVQNKKTLFVCKISKLNFLFVSIRSCQKKGVWGKEKKGQQEEKKGAVRPKTLFKRGKPF